MKLARETGTHGREQAADVRRCVRVAFPLVVRYASCWGGGKVIALQGSTVVATYTSCVYPWGINLDEATSTLLIACDVQTGTSLWAINLLTAAPTALVSAALCTYAYQVTIDPNSGNRYVSCNQGTAAVFSITQTGQVATAATSEVCRFPFGLFVDNAGDLLVACGEGGTVLSIDGPSIAPMISSSQCASPVDVQVHPLAQQLAWVACGGATGSAPTIILVDFSRFCSVGSYWNSESRLCSPCDSPGYGSLAGSTSCTILCPIGTSSTPSTVTPASSVCFACAPGSFSTTTGASACTACKAGTYQPASMGTNCLPAPVGSFVSNASSATYTYCPAGAYNPYPGQSSCLQCPAGTFSALTAQVAYPCSPCGPGTFANQMGSISLDDCKVLIHSTRISRERKRCALASHALMLLLLLFLLLFPL